jgi:hypothetical protein
MKDQSKNFVKILPSLINDLQSGDSDKILEAYENLKTLAYLASQVKPLIGLIEEITTDYKETISDIKKILV